MANNKQQAEKKGIGGPGEGANPMNMSPPNARNYVPPATIDPVPYEAMPPLLQHFMDEHEKCLEEIACLEQTLLRFKREQWEMDGEMNKAFSRFFT